MDTEYTLTAAVTTEVPTFYNPPAQEPDAFVFQPPADDAPLVTLNVPALPLDLVAEESVSVEEAAALAAPQWVYTGNGWGAYFGPDGNNIDPGVYYQADPETHQPIADLFAA